MKSHITYSVFFMTFCLSIISCAGSHVSGTEPEEMTHEEHIKAAEKEEQLADREEEKYNPSETAFKHREPMPIGVESSESPSVAHAHTIPAGTYNPTENFKKMAELHKEHAKIHEQAARELEKFKSDACDGIPVKDRKHCPLLGPVARVENISSGARLYLHKGADLKNILALSRCHYAFGLNYGHDNMPFCPLYLKELDISGSEEQNYLEITSRNDEVVKEIQSRSATRVSE